MTSESAEKNNSGFFFKLFWHILIDRIFDNPWAYTLDFNLGSDGIPLNANKSVLIGIVFWFGDDKFWISGFEY